MLLCFPLQKLQRMGWFGFGRQGTILGNSVADVPIYPTAATSTLNLSTMRSSMRSMRSSSLFVYSNAYVRPGTRANAKRTARSLNIVGALFVI